MALAIPYLYAASICAQLAEDGSRGWLHLLVMLFIWNALKMVWIGSVAVVKILRGRIVTRRSSHRGGSSITSGSEAEEPHKALAG